MNATRLTLQNHSQGKMVFGATRNQNCFSKCGPKKRLQPQRDNKEPGFLYLRCHRLECSDAQWPWEKKGHPFWLVDFCWGNPFPKKSLKRGATGQLRMRMISKAQRGEVAAEVAGRQLALVQRHHGAQQTSAKRMFQGGFRGSMEPGEGLASIGGVAWLPLRGIRRGCSAAF